MYHDKKYRFKKPRLLVTIMGIGAAVLLMSALSLPVKQQQVLPVALAGVRSNIQLFAASTGQLEKVIKAISLTNHQSVLNARAALVTSRCRYKSIEYFMEYFFKSSVRIYNAPAKYEVEEPEMEYQEPIGFQVIENLLYQPATAAVKAQLISQIEAVNTSAQDMNALLYNFETDDRQLLEGVQLELIRVMTLGITGYDAPLLKSGITESCYAMRSIETVLNPFLVNDPVEGKQVAGLLSGSIAYLKVHHNFDSFDRLRFLTAYALPLQSHLNLLIKNAHLELNTSGTLNYNAGHLFNRNFLKAAVIPRGNAVQDPAMIALGKTLFAEKSLSGNVSRSCISCHQPEKYFTDGLEKNLSIGGHARLKRNTPTLYYAAYQFSQGWDGKSSSLEDQVINVMTNPDEMGADTIKVKSRLQSDPGYRSMFKRAFGDEHPDLITMHQLAGAIAAYLRTLAPMNSPFDRYIQGNKQALSNTQIKGFNLFMGKAQCGTCHFAPLFNGLTPPYFQVSEYEILGVPATGNLKRPKQDSDLGRYDLFPIRYYKGAFKTPTVRNIKKTSPYMHNGAFNTLAQVLDFYNKGGGEGIGLKTPEQTLPSLPLKLTTDEVKAVIGFLGAITDETKIFSLKPVNKTKTTSSKTIN